MSDDSTPSRWKIVANNPINLRTQLRAIMADQTVHKIHFDSAIKAAPVFSGGYESALSSFEKKCEFLFSRVDEATKELLLQAIVTNITGGRMNIQNIKRIILGTNYKFILGAFIE